MIAVDYKGDIYPCIRYMESSLGDDVPPILVGNVYDGMMTDAKCKTCINQLKAVNRKTQSTEECFNCRIAEGCSWCQAYNYQDSGGDINHRATYICVMHRARALANSYYWNLKYHHNNEKKRMKIWLEDEKALEIIPEEELAILKLLQYPIV
jgi:radical SAM protein with 4Fe4S-binding SPASM domain